MSIQTSIGALGRKEFLWRKTGPFSKCTTEGTDFRVADGLRHFGDRHSASQLLHGDLVTRIRYELLKRQSLLFEPPPQRPWRKSTLARNLFEIHRSRADRDPDFMPSSR